jgi:hypothetical protein
MGNGTIVPERVDGIFAGLDDDGDTQVDEPLPGGADEFDCDGDGYTGSAESSIFAPVLKRDQDPCGADGWPSNLVDPVDQLPNKVDIYDITSFLGPVRRLDTNPGDTFFNPRWDLIPGKGVFERHINIGDIIALFEGPTGTPPMLGGRRGLDATCPWPP